MMTMMMVTMMMPMMMMMMMMVVVMMVMLKLILEICCMSLSRGEPAELGRAGPSSMGFD